MAASPPYPSHYSKSSYLTCPLDSCLSNAACSSLLTSFLCFNLSSISLSPILFQVSSSLVSTFSFISLSTLISALTSSSLLSVTTLVSIPPSVLLTSVLNLTGSSLLLNLSFSFSLASLLIASLLSIDSISSLCHLSFLTFSSLCHLSFLSLTSITFVLKNSTKDCSSFSNIILVFASIAISIPFNNSPNQYLLLTSVLVSLSCTSLFTISAAPSVHFATDSFNLKTFLSCSSCSCVAKTSLLFPSSCSFSNCIFNVTSSLSVPTTTFFGCSCTSFNATTSLKSLSSSCALKSCRVNPLVPATSPSDTKLPFSTFLSTTFCASVNRPICRLQAPLSESSSSASSTNSLSRCPLCLPSFPLSFLSLLVISSLLFSSLFSSVSVVSFCCSFLLCKFSTCSLCLSFHSLLTLNPFTLTFFNDTITLCVISTLDAVAEALPILSTCLYILSASPCSTIAALSLTFLLLLNLLSGLLASFSSAGSFPFSATPSKFSPFLAFFVLIFPVPNFDISPVFSPVLTILTAPIFLAFCFPLSFFFSVVLALAVHNKAASTLLCSTDSDPEAGLSPLCPAPLISYSAVSSSSSTLTSITSPFPFFSLPFPVFCLFPSPAGRFNFVARPFPFCQPPFFKATPQVSIIPDSLASLQSFSLFLYNPIHPFIESSSTAGFSSHFISPVLSSITLSALC